MLIDTHTHLDDARYESDRDAMISRARRGRRGDHDHHRL